MESLLQVRDLTVRYRSDSEPPFTAVQSLSFDVAAGETVGLMGESGCGKSSVALAIMGLLPKDHASISGSVRFDGEELRALNERALQKVRGAAISIIYQEPAIALSPVMRVGNQIAEVIHAHCSWGWKECRKEAQAMLERVGLGPTDRILAAFPHQLSGGQCQRVVLAQALACSPRLLIADEPTAHLDARSQVEFLELLNYLKQRTGISILLISHALEVQARLADRVLVMKAGEIIEEGPFVKLYRSPSQEYTRTIMRSKASGPAPQATQSESLTEGQLT